MCIYWPLAYVFQGFKWIPSFYVMFDHFHPIINEVIILSTYSSYSEELTKSKSKSTALQAQYLPQGELSALTNHV